MIFRQLPFGSQFFGAKLLRSVLVGYDRDNMHVDVRRLFIQVEYGFHNVLFAKGVGHELIGILSPVFYLFRGHLLKSIVGSGKDEFHIHHGILPDCLVALGGMDSFLDSFVKGSW